jgi:hypothetical protein
LIRIRIRDPESFFDPGSGINIEGKGYRTYLEESRIATAEASAVGSPQILRNMGSNVNPYLRVMEDQLATQGKLVRSFLQT